MRLSVLAAHSFGCGTSAAHLTLRFPDLFFARKIVMYTNNKLWLGMALGASLAGGALSIGARHSAPGPPAYPAAVQGRNTINGHVFDSHRRPIEGVYVELLDEVDNVIVRRRTDMAGRYVFSNLSDGNFQVKVLPHGTNFVGQTRRVSIVNFVSGGSGQSYEEHFTLASKPSGKATASVATSSPGVIFVQENVPETARKAYEQAVEELDREGGDKESALAELKRAVEISPNYYLALERLGAEYFRRRQYEPARAVLLKAIEVNPRSYTCLRALGVVQYHLNQKSDAAQSLRRSVALHPASVNSQLWLGIVLVKDGKAAEAETHLKRAHDLGGDRIPDCHMYLAQIYSNSKRYREAADELEHFLRDVPTARDADNIKKLIGQLRQKAK
jgi:Tfp pilus assembly protein PilF